MIAPEVLNPEVCNLSILESLTDDNARELADGYDHFCSATASILDGEFSAEPLLLSSTRTLYRYRLRTLLQDHFLTCLEERFEETGANNFWRTLDGLKDAGISDADRIPANEDVGDMLAIALDEISQVTEHQEKCLSIFANALQSGMQSITEEVNENAFSVEAYLFSRYQIILSSVLMSGLPRHFPDILHSYFMKRLEELSTFVNGENNMDDITELPTEDLYSNQTIPVADQNYKSFSCKLKKDSAMIQNIGKVVRQLRGLGLSSMTEGAYASAIFKLLKAKVYDLAGDDYKASVLKSVQHWIQAVPLQFLQALFDYLGDSISLRHSARHSSPLEYHLAYESGLKDSHEGTIRWKLRLEYYAYETLQDLRIAKLFEIIVDYPDSSPAIEDLKRCLEYTGQHSKLVESFIASLKFRLLTAGASTNDILHQYVSTIKALRTIDPTGVFLEAVGEPIKDYLRGRKDTIKCIVTMLTDGSGGNPNSSGITGDSLLEELNRDEECQEPGNDDDFHGDDRQAWINALRWEPDPVDADPTKGDRNRRKVDILGMIVGVIGSKDQLVNEYRVMLAEKLLNKADYDIDSEIRILELLKIHFGETSMQRCEIMLNDIIDSKRTNHNIKATINQSQKDENGLIIDNVSATIISTNFWPPIQDESLTLPGPIENLLTDYAQRFHEIKTPRKLQWKKNLGAVKLELQLEDRAVEFTVTPIQAAIIMHFQDQTIWPSSKLAATMGLPVDVLNRRISFWISKGIIEESNASGSGDHSFTLVESCGSSSKNTGREILEELLGGDDEPDLPIATEEQIIHEMAVFEKFILGMLTNFGAMALDRIHNTLKMFCVADPPYDKSIQQLQSFLSGLVSEEKLHLRDGMYLLKK